MNEKPQLAKDSIVEAIHEIQMIKAQVGQMGANDFEIPALDELIRRVQSSECSPEFALQEARRIFEQKESYH